MKRRSVQAENLFDTTCPTPAKHQRKKLLPYLRVFVGLSWELSHDGKSMVQQASAILKPSRDRKEKSNELWPTHTVEFCMGLGRFSKLSTKYKVKEKKGPSNEIICIHRTIIFLILHMCMSAVHMHDSGKIYIFLRYSYRGPFTFKQY